MTDYDLLFATSEVDRGIGYDGNGRRIAMNASGSLQDTIGRNIFMKVGSRFGEGGSQRIEAQASKFRLDGKGRYMYLEGNRAQGITDTAMPGRPFEGAAEFNDFRQYAVSLHQRRPVRRPADRPRLITPPRPCVSSPRKAAPTSRIP